MLHSPDGSDANMVIDGVGTRASGINRITGQNNDGMVNAKATGSHTVSRKPTGATTDASSAFRMSLPFAFGTAAAVILAAIVF